MSKQLIRFIFLGAISAPSRFIVHVSLFLKRAQNGLLCAILGPFLKQIWPRTSATLPSRGAIKRLDKSRYLGMHPINLSAGKFLFPRDIFLHQRLTLVMMKKFCFILVAFLAVLGCQKENNELSDNTNETIYVESNKAAMRVNIRGNTASKIIMLVVHGGPGGASYFYRTQAAINRLEPKYAVAYWDQRVAGASQGGQNSGTLVMAQYGEDLKKVIQTLRFKYGQDLQVFLMGQSWGGMVCSQFMTTDNNQDLVSGWLHVNAVHNWAQGDIFSRAKLLSFGLEQIALGKNVAAWTEITSYCQNNQGEITSEISSQLNAYAYEALNLIEGFTPFDEDKVIRENLISEHIPYTNAFFNLVNPATGKLINSLQSIEFTSKLVKVTKPVLALSGNYDFVVPEESAIEFIEKVSSETKSRKLFLNSGHNLEEQEGYIDAFVQFIDENK